jgi:hypothetical protein
MVEQLVKSPSKYGGETVESEFIRVVYQSGLPTEVGVNGCRPEDVIDVVVDKLEKYQHGPLACEENREAIRYLKLAKQSLHQRIQRRRDQGVLNTMTRHQTTRTEDEHEDFSSTGA